MATSANKAIPMSRYLFNSTLTTLAVVFFTLMITTMAAYCMSKKNYRLKKLLFGINEAALMFVSAAVAIPRYIIVSKLGLVDSIWAHIVPMLSMPVGLYLVKQFIDDLPDEMIEAARLDGAGRCEAGVPRRLARRCAVTLGRVCVGRFAAIGSLVPFPAQAMAAWGGIGRGSCLSIDFH